MDLYYPIVLTFVSFLYSVSLWFSGQKLEGIFVGIRVPSILTMAVAIRQRRNDFFREQPLREEDIITLKEKESDEFTTPLGMFIIGFIIFALYLWGLLTMIVRSHKKQREEFLNDPERFRKRTIKDSK